MGKKVKNHCAVCGSGRQRNLVFFPRFWFKSKGDPSVYIPAAVDLRDLTEMPFKYRHGDEGDTWICYRCLSDSKYQENANQSWFWADRKKSSYRYEDMYEAVRANRLKHRIE